jgi:carboxypeptidase Q
MKIRKLYTSIFLLVFIPYMLIAQKENVDLAMVYKIKQEGTRSSTIDEMAYGLTDFVGPRLTGSTGNNRGNEWAKQKMEEIGLQNVRIEEARDFSRGGWDNLKTYAAMTEPYYVNFACNPVAWTGSTQGLVKGTVVLLNVSTEADLDQYKGKLAGKIILMPSTATYEPTFEPLATRYTDEQLKELSMASDGGRRRMSL